MVKYVLPVLVESGLRLAGPAFFLGMQASSIQTAAKIWTDKSVGSLSPLPFVSLLTNCVIWSFYGLLKADNTVLIPNAIGMLAGAGCASVYQSFATEKNNNLYVGASSIILLATFLFFRGNYNFLGSLGCALAITVMGAPLATLRTVIRDKSTEALPFLTSLTGWLNAFSWSSYGLIIAKDPLIYGPNLVGFALSSIQMILFLIYGLPPKKPLIAKPLF